MLDGLPQIRLRAARAGSIAVQALRDGATGRVHAVFERSAYLSVRSQLVCVGPSTLGDGPLNLLCESWPCGGARRAALRVCDPVRVDCHLLQVGRALTVSLAGAEVWSPRPIGEWDRHRLDIGLATLDEALPTVLLDQGLAPLLRASRACIEDEPPLVRAARAAAQELGRWVAKSMAGRPHNVDTETIASLVGLGPGLTPSGDDFLGGALIALSLLRENALRLSLWHTVQPLLPALSNDISAAHLAAAASGLGNNTLHDLLGAVVTGRVDLVPLYLRLVPSIGHTSGLDAMAGAVTVLRAAEEQRQHHWRHAHEQRQPRTEDEAAQRVAAELVGAERASRRTQAAQRHALVGVLRGDAGGECRDQDYGGKSGRTSE